MATFIDLPREIYLMVCALLTTTDLTKLASISRDHYLAVQQPLYSSIRIISYKALVKLVGSSVKAPVVSHLTPKYVSLWCLPLLDEANQYCLDNVGTGGNSAKTIFGSAKYAPST